MGSSSAKMIFITLLLQEMRPACRLIPQHGGLAFPVQPSSAHGYCSVASLRASAQHGQHSSRPYCLTCLSACGLSSALATCRNPQPRLARRSVAADILRERLRKALAENSDRSPREPVSRPLQRSHRFQGHRLPHLVTALYLFASYAVARWPAHPYRTSELYRAQACEWVWQDIHPYRRRDKFLCRPSLRSLSARQWVCETKSSFLFGGSPALLPYRPYLASECPSTPGQRFASAYISVFPDHRWRQLRDARAFPAAELRAFD